MQQRRFGERSLEEPQPRTTGIPMWDFSINSKQKLRIHPIESPW